MASKKYTIMLGLLGLISTTAFAQDTTRVITVPSAAGISAGTPADDSWIYAGTQYVRKGKENQQNAFLNGTEVYPAKPRNMMELGIGVGPSFMFSPVDSRLGGTGSLSLRKALGHIFSARFQYAYSINYGQDYRLRNINEFYGSPLKDPSVENAYNAYQQAGLSSYLPNYKAIQHQFSLDLIANLNTLSHYRGDPKVSYYVFAGYSYFLNRTSENLLDANGLPYNWGATPAYLNGQEIAPAVSGGWAQYQGSRHDIKKLVDPVLKNNQSNGLFKSVNGRYETDMDAIREGVRDDKVTGNKWAGHHALDLGGGIAFKITQHFNIGLEEKVNLIFDNGAMSAIYLQPSQKNSIIYSTNVRFNFNLGRSSKRIQPLWWVNPYNYIYNKLAVPYVLKDTDGDGVPDCRDKQKITPPNWFPVDADGVGTEPEPACCKELRNRPVTVAAPTCAISSLPSVTFKRGARLDNAARTTLDGAAAQLASNPNCKVKLVGYGASNKRDQQLSWDRVNAVKTYLVQKAGISEGRVIFTYGQDGNANTVDLQPTMEDGPSTVPAPHPNLSSN